jgi:predicted DNA-binding ribbon-helix-helix protein
MHSLEIDTEFKLRITNAVQTLLDQVFVIGGRTRIQDMRGRLSLACPYCGDSFDDEHKKRGNLFWDSLQYHCYNDGCHKHKSVSQLLKDFGLANNLTSNERMAIIDYVKEHAVKFDKVTTLEYDLFEKLVKIAVPLDLFYKSTRCVPILKGSYGYKVLKDRLLIHKADEFAIGSNRLMIMNLTPDKKKVIGYQIRLLNKSGPNKYLSFNIEKLRSQARLSSPKTALGIEDMEADRLNKLSTIFNILKIDFTQDITAFEGPIDSKFMRNSLGLATVNRDLDMFDDIPSVRFFFDNDNAGHNAMRDLLKKGRYVFLWKKFIKDFNLDAYRPDDMELIKDLNDVIKICYFSKLKAHQYINNYFSNNSMDSIYI